MYAEESKQLRQLEAELKGLLGGNLKDLSAKAQKLGIPDIVVPETADTTKESAEQKQRVGMRR